VPDIGGALDGKAGVAAVLFLAAADAAYNAYSATNSSPQTTELFAGERANTLWKYVKLGHVQVAGIIGFAAYIASKQGLAVWPLLGGGAVALAMHGMYAHALASGKQKNDSSTLLPR
jgi:hypothetical protein